MIDTYILNLSHADSDKCWLRSSRSYKFMTRPNSIAEMQGSSLTELEPAFPVFKAGTPGVACPVKHIFFNGKISIVFYS